MPKHKLPTQYDPRQPKFINYYLSPISSSYGNAYQSAIRAGYSHYYATNITSENTNWVTEALADKELIDQALKNLKGFISDGEDDKNIKFNATKFTLEKLHRKKFAAKEGEGNTTVNVIVTNYGTQGSVQGNATQPSTDGLIQ